MQQLVILLVITNCCIYLVSPLFTNQRCMVIRT